MIELKKALNLAISQLEPSSSTARTDAEVILAHVLEKSRTYLYSHPEVLLNESQLHLFDKLVAQRVDGTPIAYIIGTREFWSLPLKVNEDTLIPRPETELLVELTLQLMSAERNAQVLDLGTGSGAIALALAKERPDWQLYACDYSEGALQMARENAKNLTITNINFFKSNWFSDVNPSQKFHAIVSNPPYIAANDPHLAKGDLRFEPSGALVSGTDGLSALALIIEQSIARLAPEGLLLLEHGFDQKLSVTSMLKDYGYEKVQCWQDLNGNNRVSGGYRISS
ncbi:MAG: peptide chain release factor N(5)-glutamine methyltransferase [Legionella sp.]|nr:peptide chain release factor N(5)-glutamine methyltransferase [Legionella sp.]